MTPLEVPIKSHMSKNINNVTNASIADISHKSDHFTHSANISLPSISPSLTNEMSERINNLIENVTQNQHEEDILLPPEVLIESGMSVNAQDSISTLILDVSNELISEQPANENSPTIFTEETNEEFTQGDLHTFYNLKTKNFKNPCIAYLNINSLRDDKNTEKPYIFPLPYYLKI